MLDTEKFFIISLQICSQVLRYKNSRNPLIQQSLLTLVPRLAAFQASKFVERCVLHICICIFGIRFFNVPSIH